MDFRQLQYICAVAEHRSITKAAKELYISQPSLSHIIAKVEQEVGGRLFDRSTSPLTLTYAGERYVQTARQILLMNTELLKEMRDITQNMKGRLRIGMPRERASFMLPYILPKYYEQFPGMEVEVYEDKTSELMDAVRKGRTDFIIVVSHISDSALNSYPLGSEELLLAAKQGTLPPEWVLPGYPHAVDIRKLGGAPFVCVKKGQSSRDTHDMLFKSFKVQPNIVLETTSNIAAYRLAASGIGYAIVPAITVAQAQPPQKASLYSLTETPVTWETHALYRKDAYIGIAEQAFFDLAREALESLPVY